MKKFKILVALLVIVPFLSGCFFLKRSKAYQLSVALLENNPKVQETIGNIKGYGIFPMGSIKTTPNFGTAELTITVKGTKQNGKLMTKLSKTGGNDWVFLFSQFKAEDGTIIELQEGSSDLKITDVFFSDKKWGERFETPTFLKKDTVFFHVIAIGLKKAPDGKSSFAADLKVVDPDGEIILTKDSIIDATDVLPDDKLPLNFNISLNESAPDGNYTAMATIRDKMSGSIISVEKKFLIKP